MSICQSETEINMGSSASGSIGPVDLNSMPKEEFKQFLDSFDHVLSDCDGVIWMKTPLSGSGEFFQLMKRLGKSLHFVSNNSLRTKENYKELFDAAGIENGVDHLTIPSTAIASYLKSSDFNKHAYCITCPETIRVLEQNGIKCKYGPDECFDSYHDFDLDDDPDIGAVIFDSDFKVNLPKLYKALAYLKRPEVLLISGASDRYVPSRPGCLALGTGVFTDIVAKEAKRQPVLLAKPDKSFGMFAMNMANITRPDRVLFIGDMIEQDIGLGKATGFKTLLVLTSWSKEDMMAHRLKPDYYAATLGSLIPKLFNYGARILMRQ